MLLNPDKHAFFLQKIGESAFVPNLIFMGAIAGLTGINLVALYVKSQDKAETNSEKKA